MQMTKPAYFTAFHSLKMNRDAQGVLIVEFHTNGGPLTFTAQDHTDFVEAFYRIGQDRTNTIVILTGTGASSSKTSTFHRSATLLIRACGARYTMRVSKSSKIWRTSACRSSRRSRDKPMCIPNMRCLQT
jgi:hypothetical protein